MMKSLPFQILAAVQTSQLELAIDLASKGLQEFPNVSYYKFIINFLKLRLDNIEKSKMLPSNKKNILFDNELLEAWRVEINSNHFQEEVDPLNLLVRDSGFIIIKSLGLTHTLVDDRRLITLTKECAGWIFHGPYRRMGSGNYKIIIEFEIGDSSEESNDLDFGCKFDVSNDGQEIHYSIDSQSIIKSSDRGSTRMSHVGTFMIHKSVEKLVIRAFVDRPANVKLFLPRLSLMSN
jgi:hypothetical protein